MKRSPSFGRAVARGLALRCPRCGEGRLFRGFFAMNAACAACGLAFHPEQGYYIGAMYINYGATVAIGLPAALLLLGTIPAFALFLALGGFALVFPLFFFRHARGLWLAIETTLSSRTAGTGGSE